MLDYALVDKTSRWPLFHRSRRVATSALTAEEEAPGFWGPSTKIENKESASHAALRSNSPRISAALLNRSVTTGINAITLGFGIATADWQPDILICIGVMSGCAKQNSTAAFFWGGGERDLGLT